ncbi:DUF3151 domain-containing protein [Mobilicoccus massiliensis]|uniref:DUF3151 domain-containing protein n=1 Tax=Mobilicoccus massiliensis TaxID=1522310 RepID=UPI00058DDAEC|nr:DUF3151 domain-containing protein [Mobilicoccus massiliensis]
MTHENLLEPPETLLDVDPAAAELLSGADAAITAGRYPQSALAWATLAEAALAMGFTVEAYAYARTGYHRSLDQLRRAGWKGAGPVPWRHEPNQGFLRSVAALARAAAQIGEEDERVRCEQFLRDSSPEAADALGF